jgi:transposase
MAYIQAKGRGQGTLFPVVLDDLVPTDHMCRVIDAFVEQLDVAKLRFERAQPADTGRPGYDPRALLKLYLYGLAETKTAQREGVGPSLLFCVGFRRSRVGTSVSVADCRWCG